MQQLIPSNSGKALVSIVIGDNYREKWEKQSLPYLSRYCKKYGHGLIIFDTDLIDKNHKYWKKATWQKMLLGEAILASGLTIDQVCYVDADILVNPEAPDIFTHCTNLENFYLVSLRYRLPYPYEETLRRISYFRNKYYSESYPLDSVIFISLEELYKWHNLVPQDDEACMGLFVFSIEQHSDLMKSWFYKYDREIDSLTGGGDQTHFNFEIQNYGHVAWLDYRFQTIWSYDMAWKYSYLYKYRSEYNKEIQNCIESSLSTSYFLHFAGSWYESKMYDSFEMNSSWLSENSDFFNYLSKPVSGNPLGQIKPIK